MQAKYYFSMLRRWLWLLLLATLSTGMVAYWLSQQQPTIYETTVRLIIGPGIDSPNPELNSLRTGGQLILSYAELSVTRPVLQSVIDDLQLSVAPSDLARRIDVRADSETQFLNITVQASDPVAAAAIANTLAETLVRMSPSGTSGVGDDLRIQMIEQAQKIEAEIVRSEEMIQQLERQLVGSTTVEEQRLVVDQINQERTRLADAQRTIATLYNSLQISSTNQVKIVEPAVTGWPVATNTRLIVLMASLAGLVFALAIAFTFEYLDDTVKSPENLVSSADVPVLGEIARHGRLRGDDQGRIVVQALPNSRTAENYRMLGTKLLLANGSKRLKSVLLSSGDARVDEDTGEVAANLAVILAQAGSRVILVDANLQRPTVNQLFDVEDRLGGLTDVLTGQAQSPRLTPISWAPGLAVLHSGPVSYDTFALLSSNRMVNLLEHLKDQADVVVITAAPLLAFADSLILASRVDGVAIVARRGRTRREMISNVIKSLRSLDAHVIGTILDFNPLFRWPSFFNWRGQKPIRTERALNETTVIESVEANSKVATSIFSSTES